MGTGAVQPCARSNGCLSGNHGLPRLCGGAITDLRKISRLVFLELQNGNDAGMVLPRLCRTPLVTGIVRWPRKSVNDFANPQAIQVPLTGLAYTSRSQFAGEIQ